jgi:hypothetical protein
VQSLGLGIEVLDTVVDDASHDAPTRPQQEDREEGKGVSGTQLPSLLPNTGYGFNNKVCLTGRLRAEWLLNSW